jgi:hypothetical protein
MEMAVAMAAAVPGPGRPPAPVEIQEDNLARPVGPAPALVVLEVLVVVQVEKVEVSFLYNTAAAAAEEVLDNQETQDLKEMPTQETQDLQELPTQETQDLKEMPTLVKQGQQQLQLHHQEL